jgi:NitT/TauT family transport system permease protein
MGAALSEAIPRAKADSAAAPRKRRGRRWFEYKRPIPWAWAVGLGITVWVLFFGLWETASTRGWVNPLFMPPPHQVIGKLYIMLAEQSFLGDVLTSIYRIVLSFLLACTVAIPIGVLMGCFKVVDAFVNPFVAAWRYLPAPSFIPLLLMWFGAGEGSKLALLFVGVVFFLATLVTDHTRAVRTELIETSMTLGADRL